MDKRRQELSQLKVYTENIEKEVSLLLQNLQWTPSGFEKKDMVACKHNSNHSIPIDKKESHEEQCFLSKLGYTAEELLLPDPIDANAKTLVKYSNIEICEIINKAAAEDRLFKRVQESASRIAMDKIAYASFGSGYGSTCYIQPGVGCGGAAALSARRLQALSADERRAVHDAVVRRAPAPQDLPDLGLFTGHDEAASIPTKSRLEVLAELRDMKRRRAKYRVPPKTRNYSHVLRDVIKTQMDTYGEATRSIIKTEYGPNKYVSQREDNSNCDTVSRHAPIKQERDTSEERIYDRNTDDSNRAGPRCRSGETRPNGVRKDQNRGSPPKHSQNRDRNGDSKERHRQYDDRCRRETNQRGRDDYCDFRYKNVSKDRNKRYDESFRQDYSEERSGRIRNKYDDHRYRDTQSSNRQNTKYHEKDNHRSKYTEPEVFIKQEYVTDAGDNKRNNTRNDSRDRYHDREKNYDKYKNDHDSHETHLLRVDIRRDKRPESDGYNGRDDSYSKRNENNRRNYKRKYNEDEKHYSKSLKEYEGNKRRQKCSDVSIKQERESP